MSNPRTLYELTELKNSEFGQPFPRHGLKLLHWFGNDFLILNNNELCFKCNPKRGHFGFQKFRNRKDKNGVKLLPAGKFVYYEVGNLDKRSKKAGELPSYVREAYTGKCDESNMDRIIVSIVKKRLNDIYVTTHIKGKKCFNKHATYCISKNLIMDIKGLTKDEFLQQTVVQEDAAQSSETDEAVDNDEEMPFIPKRTPTQPKPKTERQTDRDGGCPCVIL